MEDLKKLGFWGHQILGIARAREVRDLAIFFDVGTGKTRTAIQIMKEKYIEGAKFVVVCPIVVMKNWKEELLKFWPDCPKVVVAKGGGNEKAKEIAYLKRTFTSFIYVINFDSLLNESVKDQLCSLKPRAVVFDESHKVKNFTAKRTKACVKIAAHSTHRYLLTGTPVANNYMDLFGQFYVLNQGDTFGSSIFAYRSRYFQDRNASMPKHIHFPNWVMRESAVEALEKAIMPYSVKAEKSKCLDLPPLVRTVRHTELSKEQRQMYEKMKRDMIAFVNDEAIVAQIALTKILRLQQITSGFVETESGTHFFRDNYRLTELKELLSELAPRHKVLVWAVFKQNYKMISKVCDELKIPHVFLTGGETQKEKDESVLAFKTDPSVRVLIGHPGSGGVGVNLQEASYSIFFSRNFNLVDDKQSEARNYRGGSEMHDKITRIDLVALNTLDEDVAEKLSQKETIGRELLKNLLGG